MSYPENPGDDFLRGRTDAAVNTVVGVKLGVAGFTMTRN
jgi:hypothetical protein